VIAFDLLTLVLYVVKFYIYKYIFIFYGKVKVINIYIYIYIYTYGVLYFKIYIKIQNIPLSYFF
jgi:hypothetical protein